MVYHQFTRPGFWYGSPFPRRILKRELERARAKWCSRITECTGEHWKFKRIDQVVFNYQPSARTLEDLVDTDKPTV
jgi:hypothetical protein